MILRKHIVYYGNLLRTKFIQRYVIKYDEHTYSPYFNKSRRYCGRKTLLADETNREIYNRIIESKPLMVARYGSTELYSMEVFDLEYRPKYDIALYTLTTNAGFFPKNEKAAQKFSVILADASRQVDMLAFWNMFREDYYIKTLMSQETRLFPLRFLEPWFSANPWTKALYGKKVLVIHPYAESIQHQYAKREELFENPYILPEFELYTLKAVQSIGGECDQFCTWFDALEWMTKEALKIDFDVALIGCGAYGMPLAANLKKAKKQAIHMGGILQILFGIKGKRWDSDPIVSKLYNASWIRPSDSEKPRIANRIEGGCYW